MSKHKWQSWPIGQKGGTLNSGARYVALWASCLLTDRSENLRSLSTFKIRSDIAEKSKISPQIRDQGCHFLSQIDPKQ